MPTGRRRQQGMQTRKHDIYDDYGCRAESAVCGLNGSGFSPGIIPDRMRDMAPWRNSE